MDNITKIGVNSMAKFILSIPDELHDRLRIEKVKRKKDINDIIIESIKKDLKDWR